MADDLNLPPQNAEPGSDLLERVPDSPEMVRDLAIDSRRNRLRNMRRRLSQTRDPRGILELQAEHTVAVMAEADVIKEVALGIIESGQQTYNTPVGPERGNISPGGLKTLAEVISQQNEAVSTVLGMPTKLTGQYSQHTTTRQVVTESVVHAPDAGIIDEDFEIEPPPLGSVGGSPALPSPTLPDVTEGEVVDKEVQ